jgi:hypothetical protein
MKSCDELVGVIINISCDDTSNIGALRDNSLHGIFKISEAERSGATGVSMSRVTDRCPCKNSIDFAESISFRPSPSNQVVDRRETVPCNDDLCVEDSAPPKHLFAFFTQCRSVQQNIKEYVGVEKYSNGEILYVGPFDLIVSITQVF